MTPFGERLRTLREERGILLKDMAADLGNLSVGPRTWSPQQAELELCSAGDPLFQYYLG